MVLQRIATVNCPGERFDLLDLYELRGRPDGPVVLCPDAAGFDRVQERPSFFAVRARLTAPLVSFFAVAVGAAGGVEANEGAQGFVSLRLSALRSSGDGERAEDVVHV